MTPMETRLRLEILPQPDLETCGPTCLQAVFRFFGDEIPLEEVIREVPRLKEGGTLAVSLGCLALKRGYRAAIFTNNLQVFDPTWFVADEPDLRDRLKAQMQFKTNRKLREATLTYLEFLDLRGEIYFENLNARLIRRYLDRSIPILTGLSATYLYQCARELGTEYDDIRGEPVGHFVVVCGYDHVTRQVLVADPLLPNPVSESHQYVVGMDRLIGAILLGILTYDSNILLIEPNQAGGEKPAQ